MFDYKVIDRFIKIISSKDEGQTHLNHSWYIISVNSDRLYWISDVKPPTNISNSFYFNIDNVNACYNVGS
jgi:hypothetical protein